MRKFNASEEVVNQIAEGVAENLWDPWTTKLAEPDAIATHKFLKDRIIWIPDVVDDNMAAVQRQIMIWNMEDFGLAEEERKPIKLLMMNYGGDAERCGSVVDTILLSKTPVWTINIGMAASAGSYIFLAGKRRFMFDRAVVMIHEGSAQMSGDAGKLADAQVAYKKMLKDWQDYVQSRTKITGAQLKKHKNDDWYIYVDECIDLNIATDKVTSLDDILCEG